QCATSMPWALHSTRCFNQDAFWKAFAVIDILMIIATVVLANLIFHDLHLPLKTKVAILISFCSEVCLIPLIVLRLFYVLKNHGSNEPTYDDFISAILTLVCVYSAVVVACIPFLKPVLRGIQSGVMGGNIRSISTLGIAQYLFSKGDRFESTQSKNRYGMKRLTGRGDSQERIITRTKEVHVEVSAPKPVHERDG
ncbi:hypothetical protein CC80DRAFT_409231, partial [Byssothecium circinans]